MGTFLQVRELRRLRLKSSGLKNLNDLPKITCYYVMKSRFEPKQTNLGTTLLFTTQEVMNNYSPYSFPLCSHQTT